MDLLKPKLDENAAILSQSEINFKTRTSVLVSSLAIVILVKKYKPTPSEGTHTHTFRLFVA